MRVELLAREQDIIAQDANRRGRFPSEVSPEGYQPMTEAEIRAGLEQAYAAIEPEPLARPSRIEGGTLHGPFPTDVPGRYEFTLVRDDGAYRVEDMDRVSIKNLEGEELEEQLKLLELGKTDVDRRLGQAASRSLRRARESALDGVNELAGLAAEPVK